MAEFSSLPKVYVLILNWNHWQDTLECLTTVDRSDYPNYQVIVVDNGSSDDSEIYLRWHRPDLEVLQTGRNLGFAGGFNVALSKILDRQDASLIWLLNNDTQVESTALSTLVTAMQSLPRTGIVSPLIFYQGTQNRVWFGGGRLQLWRGAAKNLTFVPKNLDPAPMNFISGCAMLVKAEVFDSCGLLREDYFLNVEDWEFSWRVQKGGYALYLVPQSVIYHKVGLSKSGERSFWDYYYFIRNRLFFIKDCLPWYFRLTAFSVFFMHLPLWFGKLTLARDWPTLRATVIGMWDFFRGRRGRKIFLEN